MDEAALALDIIHDNSAMLLKGLANGQVAPILYLQIEHLFALLFPQSEYGLRLFSLLCYWASLVLFYKVLRQLFSNNFIVIFALSLYVFNSTFIYYSSEIKQYISDVMVVNAILWFSTKPYRKERNRYVTLAITGAVSIFLSNVSVVMLACTGIYIIAGYFTRKPKLQYVLATFITWAAVFGVYYGFFIYNHPLKQMMLAYWTKAGGFMPLNSQLPNWVCYKFISNFFFQFYFGKIVCTLLIVLMFTGAYYLVKKRKLISIFLLLPLPLHLLLSGLKLYPFDTRLVLYLTPLLIFTIAYGISWLGQLFTSPPAKTVTIGMQLLVPLVLIVLLVVQSFPLIRHDDLRRCISFMNGHATKSDDVFVTLSAKYPLEFYHDIRYYKARQMIWGSYTPSVASSYKDDNELLKAELMKPLSNRVWIYSLKIYHDDSFITRFLRADGYAPAASYSAGGNAVVYLYTLKNKSLLPRATAPGHPITNYNLILSRH